MQMRLVAGATVLIVFVVVLGIVATVLVLRTKSQDDLDKKTSNHLPLPLDYASNEGDYYRTLSPPVFFCDHAPFIVSMIYQKV